MTWRPLFSKTLVLFFEMTVNKVFYAKLVFCVMLVIFFTVNVKAVPGMTSCSLEGCLPSEVGVPMKSNTPCYEMLDKSPLAASTITNGGAPTVTPPTSPTNNGKITE